MSIERAITATCDARRVHRYSPASVPLRTSDARCVVWWIARSQRSHDNLTGDLAIELANELGVPVVALFRLGAGPPENDMRHAAHMLAAFDELAQGLTARNIAFCVLEPAPLARFADAVATLRAAAVVCDDDAMQHAVRTRTRVAQLLDVPLLAVDADVIVPRRVFAKQEHAAYTLRPKLQRVLHEFDGEQGRDTRAMVDPPLRRPSGLGDVAHWIGTGTKTPLDIARLEASLLAAGVPDAAGRVQRTTGMHAARGQLRRFVDERLEGYATRRNQPQLAGTSELSVFLHYGHVSPHVVLDAVRSSAAPADDISAFVEEFTVRRELAVNFASFAEADGRTLACAPDWAQRSLAAHARDERPARFTEAQMLACETHDPLWNAAQRQMLETGTMHGYLRMYWAKQILTWTRTPAHAFEVALRMHDRYSMDARDPNSITGVAWAIGGVHDRAWPERSIFGKVRSMTFASTSRKFDSAAYIQHWSGFVGPQSNLST